MVFGGFSRGVLCFLRVFFFFDVFCWFSRVCSWIFYRFLLVFRGFLWMFYGSSSPEDPGNHSRKPFKHEGKNGRKTRRL